MCTHRWMVCSHNGMQKTKQAEDVAPWDSTCLARTRLPTHRKRKRGKKNIKNTNTASKTHWRHSAVCSFSHSTCDHTDDRDPSMARAACHAPKPTKRSKFKILSTIPPECICFHTTKVKKM